MTLKRLSNTSKLTRMTIVSGVYEALSPEGNYHPRPSRCVCVCVCGWPRGVILRALGLVAISRTRSSRCDSSRYSPTRSLTVRDGLCPGTMSVRRSSDAETRGRRRKDRAADLPRQPHRRTSFSRGTLQFDASPNTDQLRFSSNTRRFSSSRRERGNVS